MGIKINRELKDNRKIITLIGSTKFMNEFRKIEKYLALKGEIVLLPAIFHNSEGIHLSLETEQTLLNLAFDKIRLSDEIFVIDVGGYIGESTKKEIEFAKSIGKKIGFYSEIGERV